MPRSKQYRSLAIIIKGRSQRWRELYSRVWSYPDHCYLVSRKDLTTRSVIGSSDNQPLTNFESVFIRGDEVNDLAIFSSAGTARELELILGAVDCRLAEKSSITLGGFRITARQFQSLTEQFESVHLLGCSLTRGWWKPVTGDRACQRLTLDTCAGATPSHVNAGQSAWPALADMYVDEGPIAGDSAEFAAAWVRSFWHANLRSFDMRAVSPIDFLASLPPQRSLVDMYLDSPVTPPVFEWLLCLKSLRDLHVNWEPGVRLKWRELRRLKRLGFLSVAGAPLIDEELREIATNPRLRTVHAFYTKLTPSSWPVILSWPGLRQFWGSTELSGGPIPEGLPETTELREFVALNARTEWFEDLLRRYPNVELSQM